MTVKGLKKQLMAAIAMVLVSVIALGSSTYAWFSMNTQVTAKGMSVTAKSDSTFLLIGDSASDVSSIQTAKSIEADGTAATAALYPTAHNSDVTNITTAEAATSGNLTNWWYSYSTDPADDGETDNLVSNGGETKFSIATTDIGKYILVNEFHITTAAGSNELENLRVASCTIATSGDAAVKVLVAGANGCEEFSGAGGAGSGTAYLQTANVTDAAVSTVKVYIYWDGQDDDVNTNNIDQLLETTVQVVFTGDVVNS